MVRVEKQVPRIRVRIFHLVEGSYVREVHWEEVQEHTRTTCLRLEKFRSLAACFDS